MFKNSFILLSLIILIGCSSKQNANVNTIEVKVKLERNDDVARINDFLKFSHFVPLETNKDVLIGDINKLQIINNKIYILCRKQLAIFIFDMNGKFLSKIEKIGKGPGEYLGISDFEATSDGLIYLNDPLQGKIYVYDESGNFKRNIEFPQKTWSFKILPDNKYALNMANGFATKGVKPAEYNYVCVSGNDKILNENIPFNKALIGHKFVNGYYSSLFYQYNDITYMSSMLNDTIYTVSKTSGELSPYVAFNFNTKRPGVSDSPKYVSEYLESVRAGESPSIPYDFYHFSNAIMAFYSFERKPYIMISSLEGEILYSSRVGYDENGMVMSYMPYLDSDNTGYVIQAASPSSIFNGIRYLEKSNKDHALLSEIASHITEDDNPVLLFYKWIY